MVQQALGADLPKQKYQASQAQFNPSWSLGSHVRWQRSGGERWENQESTGPTMQWKSPYGTDIQMSVALERNPAEALRSKVQLSQPLNQGFRKKVNQIDLYNAKDAMVRADYQNIENRNEVTLQGLNAYWDTILAERNYELSKRGHDRAQALLETVNAQIESGRLSDAHRAQALFAVEQATLTLQQTRLSLRHAEQGILLQLMYTDDITLPTQPTIPEPTLKDVTWYLEHAEQRNIQLRSMPLDLAQVERVIARAKEAKRLSVNWTVDADKDTVKGEKTAPVSVSTGLQLKMQLGQQHQKNVTLGEAKVQLSKLKLQQSLDREKIMVMTVQQFERAESLKQQAKQLEQASLNADISADNAESLFDAGRIRLQEVLQLQEQATTSHESFEAGKIAYLKQVYSLEKVSGLLIERWELPG